MASSSSRRLALVAVACVALAPGSIARAQATQPAVVHGHVAMPRDSSEVPIPGVMVTVHRVGSDSAGPVDSALTDAAGRFTIRYRRGDDDPAVYFAAAVFRGIAYFTAPLKSRSVDGEDGGIIVFDTTSGHVPLTVQGHHLVISGAAPNGSRKVFEVWEISNDTSVTLVGRDTLAPVWTAPFASGATDLVGGQGDVSAASIVLRDGRIGIVSPFGPGVKQFSYSYSLPSSAFPLTVPLEAGTQVLEVLVEDQEATASGGGLKGTAAAITQGRTFKRYQAQQVPASTKIRIQMPSTSASARQWLMIILSVLVAMAMAVALWIALRRRSVAPGIAVMPRSSSEELVAAIARLDMEHERGTSTLDDAQYQSTRGSLKARLAAALAVEDRGT